MRAQRSNPDCRCGSSLDCFVARAPRNDGGRGRRAAPPRYRRFLQSRQLFIKILRPGLAGSHQLCSIIASDPRETAELEETCRTIRANMPA
ncbi:hypothetical protein EAS61_33195 [Bradyrhizobium zhanjiangense]|uniref:Uncharacterized protein n=1 Tax=Bradyrhizobium zhanjiangense TaxID=1325107 RepID=A0A4Q0QAL6_9BRAD|nr:hypothetical protein EAS61_33195 [Bradyrhizobium zhanjiangense]